MADMAKEIVEANNLSDGSSHLISCSCNLAISHLAYSFYYTVVLLFLAAVCFLVYFN